MVDGTIDCRKLDVVFPDLIRFSKLGHLVIAYETDAFERAGIFYREGAAYIRVLFADGTNLVSPVTGFTFVRE